MPHELKQERPDLTIVLNGGLRTSEQVREWLPRFDGVMLGRQAYQEPYLLAELGREWSTEARDPPTREAIVLAYAAYVDRELARGQRLSALLRHVLGLYAGQPAARAWRRMLAEQGSIAGATGDVLRRSLRCPRPDVRPGGTTPL